MSGSNPVHVYKYVTSLIEYPEPSDFRVTLAFREDTKIEVRFY